MSKIIIVHFNETDNNKLYALGKLLEARGIRWADGEKFNDFNERYSYGHLLIQDNCIYQGMRQLPSPEAYISTYGMNRTADLQILSIDEALKYYEVICENCGCIIEDVKFYKNKSYCPDCYSQIREICSHCGKELNADDVYVFNHEIYCVDCLDELTCFCDDCGARVFIKDVDEINGRLLCDECCENYYECSSCGRIEHYEEMYCANGDYYCEYCFNEWFYICDRCGCTLDRDYDEYHFDDDYVYCDECYYRYVNRNIHDYGYKPDPIFYGNDSIYMGIELEIDGGGEDGGNAEEILNIANYEKTHIYCKHDGSLNYGFEIVSHPCTIDYHTNNIDWSGICEKALSMGYTSHNAETCGLHIHVNKSAYNYNADVEARILYFIEKHFDKMLIFSRRTESQLNRWASRYGLGCGCKDTYDKAIGKCQGRYSALNLTNRNTIEFRFFRGTLKYTTFIATLQLVYNIMTYCINIDEKSLESSNWCDFVSYLDTEKYTALIEYLKEKQIYNCESEEF